MICSKTKLGSELDRVKQLFIEKGYPDDVLLSCIKQKLANFAAEKPCGPEKCTAYLKLPRIGNVSSKFESGINKAITSYLYAVNLVWPTVLRSCYHLLKKIAFLPLKKVVWFTNICADVKLGT